MNIYIYIENYQSTLKTSKIAKIPLNLENYQSTPKTSK